MQQLQGAVKGLTKLLQNNQQQAQLPQVPRFVPQTGQKGTQENVNTLSQATMVKVLLLLKEEEVVEVATGVEVVEVEVD